MTMTSTEIIHLLGGVTSVARMLEIKPPSVHAWLEDGIPEGRLRELASQIELKSAGRFTRREQWPEKYTFYWPELAIASANQSQVAIETVAHTSSAIDQPGALRAGVIRRQTTRRAVDPAILRAAESTAIKAGRRAQGGPPFQANVTGVA